MKPVDVGTGMVVASFGCREPSLLSLTTTHPTHGVVELAGAVPFDESGRGTPDAVRAYRAALADDASACCWLEAPDGERCTDATLDATDPAAPHWLGHLGTARLAAAARAVDPAVLELRWQLDGWQSPAPPQVRFAGRLALSTLAEITETNPLPPSTQSSSLRADGGSLTVSSSELSSTASLALDHGAWQVGAEHAATWASSASGKRLTIVLRVTIGATEGWQASRRPAATPAAPPDDEGLSRLTTRALAYVRGCTALRTGTDERVILTDHRLLPLSWTRDAYYQALLLLAAGTPADTEAVADHLRWLWRRCDRPEGLWARSHHADGRRKDLAFQADQQVYPVLEACDYWRLTGSLPDGVDWTDAVAAAWSQIMARTDTHTGLLATVENAADDPAAAPFVASSQILLWYAARRLTELAAAAALGLDAAELVATADRLRNAFRSSFEAQRPWPYAVDGKEGSILYHDANDLPLALAPVWGLCAPGDDGWRATMDFAWSSRNPGWFGGERGGVGSVHTPHPWALGDVQDWLVGRATGDAGRCARAVERLNAVAFVDGMLPEAYSAGRRPDVRIRHWFAWPGAAFGALQLLDARGEVDLRLRA